MVITILLNTLLWFRFTDTYSRRVGRRMPPLLFDFAGRWYRAMKTPSSDTELERRSRSHSRSPSPASCSSSRWHGDAGARHGQTPPDIAQAGFVVPSFGYDVHVAFEARRRGCNGYPRGRFRARTKKRC